jgi:hypothetical protein
MRETRSRMSPMTRNAFARVLRVQTRSRPIDIASLYRHTHINKDGHGTGTTER